MYQFSFEKLKVWQEARALTKKIYGLSSKFPKEEVFCLTNQIRRASISICSNLAEGSSRRSNKEQQHLYQISYSSLMEVYNQLIIANDLGYINNDILDELRDDVQHISILHTRLRNSLVN
jgi:four helix bundle protein